MTELSSSTKNLNQLQIKLTWLQMMRDPTNLIILLRILKISLLGEVTSL